MNQQHPQPRRSHETFGTDPHLNSPTQVLLVLLALLGAFLYARFLLNPQNSGDWLPYLFVVLAESFIIFQAAIALWTILSGGYNPRGFDYYHVREFLFSRTGTIHLADVVQHPPGSIRRHPSIYLKKKTVSIDVFITVYGEPIEIVRHTAEAARDMLGKHLTYILDDGKSDAVRALAEELGIGYLRRENNEGAKAGNINAALRHTSGDFYVIFDADFTPKESFLFETMPFFSNRATAFVQTPQYYRNQNNLISRGAGYMQRVFYRLIQPGKNRFNAAFCVGTNVVFRRSAIEEIGGMYQDSNSEDIWTSILLHEHGYKSVFIPDILAVGDTPDTIKAYIKQQLRWATGGMEIFFRHNPLLKRLTIDQKIQYLSTSAYYLQGVATGLLLLLPPLHIFFNLTPVNLSIGFDSWLFFYLAFYAMQIVVAFYIMGGFRFETLILAAVSFPIYVRAMLNVLFKRQERWHVTGRKDAIDSPFNYIVPQMLIFLFLLFTSAIGLAKAFYVESFSIAIFWNLCNTIIFGIFLTLAWREHRTLIKQRKQSVKLQPTITPEGSPA